MKLQDNFGLTTERYTDDIAILGVRLVSEDRDSTLVRVCRELGDYYHEALHAVTGDCYKEYATLGHVQLLLRSALRAAQNANNPNLRSMPVDDYEERLPFWGCKKPEGSTHFSSELHPWIYAHIVKVLIHLLPSFSHPIPILDWLDIRFGETDYPSPMAMYIDTRKRFDFRYESVMPTKEEVVASLTAVRNNGLLNGGYGYMLRRLSSK